MASHPVPRAPEHHLPGHCPPLAGPAHAEQLAAGGPGVLDALLRLALAGALTPASVRSLLPHITAPTLPGRFRGSAGSRADSRPAGHGPPRWRPATGTGRWPRRSC